MTINRRRAALSSATDQRVFLRADLLGSGLPVAKHDDPANGRLAIPEVVEHRHPVAFGHLFDLQRVVIRADDVQVQTEAVSERPRRLSTVIVRYGATDKTVPVESSVVDSVVSGPAGACADRLLLNPGRSRPMPRRTPQGRVDRYAWSAPTSSSFRTRTASLRPDEGQIK